MALPNHIAIIMDGNGRWAKLKGKPRAFGHIKGARVARDIIEACASMKINHLTLYTFSTENWSRPIEEVSLLMKILQKYIVKERAKLMAENIRFSVIGDISSLPAAVGREVNKTIEETKINSGLSLTFALNYGGRQEIVNAIKRIAEKVDCGEISSAFDINESLVDQEISAYSVPDPDLIIRTSGEKRISNFLLWQSAYSELYFTDVLWPDFKTTDLQVALKEYSSRERRFGHTTEQIKDEADGKI